jgi:hypothetical protein
MIERAVAEILAVAVASNQRDGITGALIMTIGGSRKCSKATRARCPPPSNASCAIRAIAMFRW